jgi:hypothetical protein
MAGDARPLRQALTRPRLPRSARTTLGLLAGRTLVGTTAEQTYARKLRLLGSLGDLDAG